MFTAPDGTAQVRIESVGDIFVVQPCQKTVSTHPGAVDQDVDVGLFVVDKTFGLVWDMGERKYEPLRTYMTIEEADPVLLPLADLADVAVDALVCIRPCRLKLLQLLDGLVYLCRITADEADFCSLAEKAFGNGEPDALVSTRDDALFAN